MNFVHCIFGVREITRFGDFIVVLILAKFSRTMDPTKVELRAKVVSMIKVLRSDMY